MPIRLYNTQTQTKEEFRTLEPGKVRMYVCGPTVYSASHIGHMVGPVVFDTLKRFLTHCGYEVTWVVNITDIDDKLITRGAELGISVPELAERVTADYLACLKALNVTGIDRMPRATEYVPQILDMISRLIERDFAYPADGDVYFDISKAKDYGKLSHRHPDELMAGARIEPGSRKRNPGDFALWKGAKPGEPAWESPWGPGRPGWHIECSAMSLSLLGERLDIHGGGLDLVFPHHENEVAQSESYTDKPFVSYWMHNGLLTKGGRKISKSDPDTIVEMAALLKLHGADTLRALYLMSHYRRPTDFGNERLEEIERALAGFEAFFERYERLTGESFHDLETPSTRSDEFPGVPAEIAEHRRKYFEALDDDFNTGGAFGELFDTLRALNRLIDASGLESGRGGPEALESLRAGARALREMTRIFGLFLSPAKKAAEGADDGLTPDLMALLLELRGELRKAKQFALADRIRDRLGELGVTLEDRPDGTRWRRERGGA